MAATTHPHFNGKTEALEVASAFPNSIRGKTILVTGVNRGGLGFSTSQALASQSPALLIVAGRNQGRIEQSIDALAAEYPNVKVRSLLVDLSSQESVRKAAAEVLAWNDVPSLDILINSAGIMGIDERTITPEGIELHFATNHIGHWLLSCLLMPKLIAASKINSFGATRIVNVGSAATEISGMRWSDMNFEIKNKDLPIDEQPPYEWFKLWGYKNMEETSYIPLDAYCRSKVANIQFGIGANRRLLEKYGILTVGLHPGIISTELPRNFGDEMKSAIAELLSTDDFKNAVKTLGAGASTSLVAALDPKLARGVGQTKHGVENYGAYLVDCQISSKSLPRAVASAEAEKLWQLSEKLTGQAFSW